MQDPREILDVKLLQERCYTAERSLAHLHEVVEALQRRIAEQDANTRMELQQQLKEVLAGIKAAERAQHTPGNTSESRADPVYGPKNQKPQVGHGPQPQPNLPEVIEPIEELDEADRVCPCCGKPLLAWEDHTADAEEIDVNVEGYVRRIRRRQKYRCPCGVIENALVPPKVVPGGRYSNEVALQVVVKKHVDHMPLTRQVATMARHGLVVTSQTLWDLEWALYQLLKDLHERLRQYILSHAVVGADETRWPVFGKEMKNWTMWCLSVKLAVYFDIKDGRGAVQAEALLKGFSGTLMVDGFVVYMCVAKLEGQLVLAFCWSHVRRHFTDVERAFPVETKAMVDLIQELFAVEHEATSREELARLRLEKSVPVLARIKEFLTNTKAIPESGLHSAMKYTANRWTGLTRFVDNPDIPLTNNETERGQRGPVVGRKNHYGSQSTRGTQVSAFFYSVFETAKRCGVNPEAYGRYAMNEKLAGRIPLLPHELMDRTDLQLPKPVRPPPRPPPNQTKHQKPI